MVKRIALLRGQGEKKGLDKAKPPAFLVGLSHDLLQPQVTVAAVMNTVVIPTVKPSIWRSANTNSPATDDTAVMIARHSWSAWGWKNLVTTLVIYAEMSPLKKFNALNSKMSN